MRSGLWYTVVAAGVAVLVGVLGGAALGGEGRRAVWTGASVAFAVQVVSFWLLFVWAFPHRGVLAHGLGMLVRMATVGVVALLWLPLTSLRAGPLLFSLVGVFFLTTLFEPVIMKIGLPRPDTPAAARH